MDPITIEKLLLEKLSDEQLSARIEKKIAAFQGLLTREVALKIIAKEEGLLKEEAKFYALKEVPSGGRRINVRATVVRVFPAKSYPSGNRSRTMLLKDDSGQLPFTLWNDDVPQAGQLKAGDRLELQEAYEKRGELLLSYRGAMVLLESAAFVPLIETARRNNETVVVRGFVSRIEGKKTELQADRPRPSLSFTLRDSSSEAPCILFEGIDRAAQIQEGDEVILENARIQSGALHVAATTRLLVKKIRGIRGPLEAMSADDISGQLRLRVGGKDVALNRSQALALLGLDLPSDITLSTIVTLKKDSLLNTFIAVDIPAGN